MSLRRTPKFSLFVVATLALTIGPTTAILSIGNWLIWRPVPHVVEPDRLGVVWFGQWRGTTSVSPRRLSDQNLADLAKASRTIAGFAGWQEGSMSLAADGVSPRQTGAANSDVNFFSLLGVRPVAGRDFGPEDNHPPFGSPVVIVSHRLATELFGEPATAIGKNVRVNGRSVSIVGVMPDGFEGARPFSRVDVWLPARTNAWARHFKEEFIQSRAGRGTSGAFYSFVVRLRPDATFEAAQAELDVLVPALAAEYPAENQSLRTAAARIYPGLGADELSRDRYQTLVRNLLVVGALLLLLGSANVTNLLISRSVQRQHDRAVRVALGATRARLVQLLLTESALLAVAGAGGGVVLAVWLKQFIQTLLLPQASSGGVSINVPMDLRVLTATLGISLACGLAAALAPAWMNARSTGATLGRENSRVASSRQWLRTGFATVQLALSLALVTNATLLVGTLHNLTTIPPGFEPRGVSVHFINLDGHGYTDERARAYDRELLNRLAADATFESVSLSASHPPSAWNGGELFDPRSEGQERVRIFKEFLTEDYFRTLSQPLLYGRTFTRSEALDTPQEGESPVILNAALAERLFGTRNVIGRQVTAPGAQGKPGRILTVVGVAGDIRGAQSALADQVDFMVYLPFSYGGTFDGSRPTVMIRSARPLRDVGDRVLAHASAIDSSVPVSRPVPLTAVMARPTAERRAFAWVLALLGGLGFLLSAVGLYGLLSQLVTERTREFGIRIAIGADRRRILTIVLKQASWIAGIGGAIGIGLATSGSVLVESQLFGVTRLEPWAYAASAAGMMIVVFIGSLWPARAATRIEPVEALRAD